MSPADDGTAEWAICLKSRKKIHKCRLQTTNNIPMETFIDIYNIEEMELYAPALPPSY